MARDRDRVGGARGRQGEPPAPTVRYRNDKLSVDAHGVDLAAVLNAIARESGAELVGAPRAEQTITVAFDDVP